MTNHTHDELALYVILSRNAYNSNLETSFHGQAYYSPGDNRLVVAIQGTESFTDLKGDLRRARTSCI